ncbi:D-isomer specific 2-hydroxyacid dehydrogenase family protein [Clostridium folliculivorans]|uniref:Lactate dehydrogenase n=1 Tax=Clostridium folliculivorans TaxID=2886038 RepID=A0A9W6DAH5_9CLOT|nr:D-isomer specific 2-hydroxyacid dehydrogenase family protein [Clostridium folliculivorans]GKU24976.1 lactate dehydrogenase [Clostridium folliculivorans]GKU31074.1 lactate dehydrogenase [Clostridium folliculivorans]
MKLISYDTRDDERNDFDAISKKLKVEITLVDEKLNEKTAELAKGFDGVTILGHSHVTPAVLDKLDELNIKYIATRTVGYNNIDVEYAKSKGIRVSNAYYAPNGVADYTIMLILMCIRHYKQAMFRGNVNDYSLVGLQGKEMKDLTIGVIGTGKIGATVIDGLKGFGSRILAYDKFENDIVREKATYVDLDTLYKESDVITLHTPLLESTYHMINDESIKMMKDNVVLINCARGELMNIPALINGIETRRIGALGLDVFENEEGIYHIDRRTDIISNRDMAYLRQFPNVIMTQHMAFYTDAAVTSMVNSAITSLVSFINAGESDYEIR